MKHYVCRACGNLVAMINDTGRRIGCCSKNMDEVTPNLVEEAREKHTPSVREEPGRVIVTVGTGENIHPMTAEHGISWVCLVTTDGTQRKMLVPGKRPEVVFHVGEGERVIKAFAYCNIHGLWLWEAAD